MGFFVSFRSMSVGRGLKGGQKMKQFVVTLILLLAVSGYAYAQSTLALQEKCTEGAKKFFYDRGFKFVEEGDNDTKFRNYQCHYNKKVDKCFILITSSSYRKSGGKEGLFHYEALCDVFEGKIYGEISGLVGGSITGTVMGKFCKSQDEFETLIKAYMED
jgi:hypothetical protein